MIEFEYSEIPEYEEKGKKQIKIPNEKKDSLKTEDFNEAWIDQDGYVFFKSSSFTQKDEIYKIEDFIDVNKKEEAASELESNEQEKIEEPILESEKVEVKEYTGITYEDAKKIANENGNTVFEELIYEKVIIEPENLSLESKEEWEKYFLHLKPANTYAKLFIDKQLRELLPEKYKTQYDTSMEIMKNEHQKQSTETKEEQKNDNENKTINAAPVLLYTVTRKLDGGTIAKDISTEELATLYENQEINNEDYTCDTITVSLKEYMNKKLKEKNETKEEMIKLYTITRKSDNQVVYEDLTYEEYTKLFQDGIISLSNVINDYNKAIEKTIPLKEYLDKKAKEGKVEEKTNKETVTNKEQLSTTELSEKVYQKEILEKIAKMNNKEVDITQIFVGGIVTIEENGLTKDEICKAIQLIPKNKEYISYLIDKKHEGKTIKEYAEKSKIDLNEYQIMIETEYWIDATNNPSIIGIETQEEYYKRCFPEAKQR